MIKKLTDRFAVNAREEMRRLRVYYRHMGKCWHCKQRILYGDFGAGGQPTAWSIEMLAVVEGQSRSREVPVCRGCEPRGASISRDASESFLS